MREQYIEFKLRNAVKANGGLALKFTSPGTVGVPDRIVLIPDGRVYFVELKAPGKKPSAKQRKMAAIFSYLGHKIRVIDSVQAVKEFTNEIFPS
jgi:hypothetical protein